MEKNLDFSLRQRIMNFQHEQVEIKKTTRGHNYNYASLDVVIPIILPLLKKYEIGFYHTTGWDKDVSRMYVETILFCTDKNDEDILKSRTHIDENTILAKMNKFMVIGSAMTYFRRYHLALMLGLLTDEDTDAGGMQQSSRSVDSSARTQEVDYMSIFKNQIDKGKTKKQMEAIFKTHESNIDSKVAEEIKKLINELK